jgi:L-2-hydroxyglutarate oxidase LhgO
LEQYKVDVLVIGAGVIGLAVARELAKTYHGTGKEVWLLERNESIGLETSSRNSEVIHAGIYYAPKSLKARLCVKGRQALYAYCEANQIPNKRCGKLIVACNMAQEKQLQQILGNAEKNGVNDLRLVDKDELHVMEPELRACAALLSPSTGVIDSHAYMTQLLADFEAFGGQFVAKSELSFIAATDAGSEWEIVGQETRLLADKCVNSAGLFAAELLADSSIEKPQVTFAKGDYFSYASAVPFTHLVYPVPEDGGLGVHLTLDMAGSARFGPDVTWLDVSQKAAELNYQVNVQKRSQFTRSISRYWPSVDEALLHSDYSGVRPKLSKAGEPAADFLIQGAREHGVAGLVNLFGMESPGLTASLAIAEYVCDMLTEEQNPS